MANPDFKKVIFKDALLQWPKLNATYRFNSAIRQSEQCAPSAQGAAWSCGFLVTAEEAKAIWQDLQAHYKDCQSRNSKMPPFSTVFGMKKQDNGTVIFSAKKAAMSKSGQPNKEPSILAGDLTPLADKAIWTGSVGTARCIAFPSVDPQGNGGISLLLDAIQVTKAVYGQDDNSDFTPVAMQTEVKGDAAPQDDDPFGLPPVQTPQAAPPQPVSLSLDDEIPF